MAAETVLVSLIAGASGLFGALAGGWASVQQTKHSGGAVIKAADMERVAKWQEHKRETYAALLEAARSENVDGSDVEKRLSAAVLVASEELRGKFLSLPNVPEVLRAPLWGEGECGVLLEMMSADARQREAT